MIADTEFWDCLNHWRGHAGLAAMPHVAVDLASLLPVARKKVADCKAGVYDSAITSDRYVLSPSAPSHTARFAFALKCLARVTTRQRKVDRDGKEIEPFFDGWITVQEMLASVGASAAA
jgi:hypothetical protein